MSVSGKKPATHSDTVKSRVFSQISFGAKLMKRILRPKQAAAYLSLSLATLWRLNKEGDFPQKIKLSVKAVGWFEEDIAAWLEKRKSI
jgi:prophage regulatory protein